MAKGCLWLAASLLFGLLWCIGLVFFIAEGPRHILLNELFGMTYAALSYLFVVRCTPLVRVIEEGAARRRMRMFGRREHSAAQPGSTQARIESGLGWVLTAFMGSLAFLSSAIAYALWFEGTRDANMATVAVFSGMMIVATFLFWKNIPHLGRER